MTEHGAATSTSLGRMLDVARWSWRYVRQTSPRRLTAVIGLTLVRGGLPAIAILIMRELVNTVAAGIQGEPSATERALLLLAAGLLIAVASGVIGQANRYASRLLQDEVNMQVTLDILEHARLLDIQAFEDPELQDVMERAQQNTGQHVTQFVMRLLAASQKLAESIGLFVILVAIEPWVLAITLPILLPFSFLEWRLARDDFLQEHSRATKRRWTRYFVSLLTNRRMVPEVRLLDLGAMLIERYRLIFEQFLAEDRRLYRRGLLQAIGFALSGSLAFYVVFGRVVLRAIAGGLSLGDVAAFGGGVSRLRGDLEGVVSELTGAMTQTLFVSNLATFLALEPDLQDHGRPLTEPVRGELELRHVSFTYPGTDRPVLEDVSFKVHPGETVAIVGENGAGKTTLAKLVVRLYDPTAGVILLDGRPLPEIALASLYQTVSFVFQDFNRYEASAAENIAYGDWRRTPESAWLEAVADEAGARELIERMPQGWDTKLGRMFGEFDLSGGQWQKLAIARAFARPARLLILDEPTSNLDARAEARLFNQFRQLARDRTTILISHRFSTVRMADRIVVLHEGQLLEQGSHDELVQLDGLYASLYRLQAKQLLNREQYQA